MVYLAVTELEISIERFRLFLLFSKMKKIFLFTLLLISSSSFAQNWERTEFKADELKGTESYITFSYEDKSVGSFVCWDNSDNCRIINNLGIFDYKTYYNQFVGNFHNADVVVGLYDDNDNLKQKYTLQMYCDGDKPSFLDTRNGGLFLPYVSQKKKVKKIKKFLTSGKGYIRIIAKTYGTSPDFDLKIPATFELK